MKIIGVYNSTTEKLVTKYVDELVKLGYLAEAIDIEYANKEYNVSYTPSFNILKNNKLGYSLNGKQDFTRVLSWIQESGILCK
jgi:hypothetical protein